MKSRGFGTIEIVVVVAALGLAAAVLWYVDQRGYARGAAETAAKWQARELKQQQTYDAEYKRLTGEKNAALGRFNVAMAEADAKYHKERAGHDAQKRRNAQLATDIRDGRVVLHDPGRPAAPCQADSGGRPADPATAGGGNAAAGPGLSAQLGEFLFAEADRADEVVDQLGFAQTTIMAYYKLALDCRGGT